MFNIYDLVDVGDLNAVVRQLAFDDLVLGRWLPNVTVDRVDFRYVTNDRAQQPAAKFVAYDAEAPIGGRPGLTARKGSLPPIKEKAVLTESDQFLAERLAAEAGDALAAAVFADAALRTRAILQRLELAKGQALYTGTVVINEGGLALTVDYGVPPAHMNVAPTVLWSDRANATPLTNLAAWRDIYVTNAGQQPSVLLTSQTVMTDLQLNAELRGAMGSTRTRITRDEVNALLISEGLPEIVVYDSLYKGPTGAPTRAIPADRLLFLPAGSAGFGETQMGRTREGAELARAAYLGGDDQPGVAGVAVVTMKSFDPVEVWVKAAAVALPVISQPEQIFSADVR